jgi:hypothetical protein
MFENHRFVRPVIRSLGSAVVVTALLITINTSAIAAECKGMAKGQCEGNNACVWVDSYQRKDGVKVDGYCRSKGKKKSSSSS